MPGYVERNGMLHFKEVANKLISDLQRLGFVICPGTMDTSKWTPYLKTKEVVNPDTSITIQYTAAATLESTSAVDPIAADVTLTGTSSSLNVPAQPWRIRIDSVCDFLTAHQKIGNASPPYGPCPVYTNDQGCMRVFAGHALQLPDNGTVTVDFKGVYEQTSGFGLPRFAGEMTCGYIGRGGTNNSTWNRTYSNPQQTATDVLTLPFASSRWADPSPMSAWNSGVNESKPISYMLSVTDRGIAFCVWQEAQDSYANKFSWFVIQRPVNPDDGTPLIAIKTVTGTAPDTTTTYTPSKCPVFCVYSIGGGNPKDIVNLSKYYDSGIVQFPSTGALYAGSGVGGDVYDNYVIPYLNYIDSQSETASPQTTSTPYDYPRIFRFTVREADVLRPTMPVFATVDSPDCKAVINAKQQVAIDETGKFVIFYPNGFNTERYIYREEIDMLTYTSSDVVSQWQEVTFAPYGNGSERKYKACQANVTNNRGMRFLIVCDGSGIVRGLDYVDPPVV